MPDSEGDCLGCKLTTFAGLTAAGSYVASHVKKQPGVFGKGILSAVSIGLIYVGIARLAGLPPYGTKTRSIQQTEN